MVIPGEDSRNKQLREIQQLLASAPIVVSLHPSGAAHVAPASLSADSDTPSQNERHGGDDSVAQPLVLPSVPVDQLLDDHSVEFEECKRWANSEAGQSAHMTNPAGFANVRAHAEAHLRAMGQTALPQMPVQPQPSQKGKT
jgi:hypothetical protein